MSNKELKGQVQGLLDVVLILTKVLNSQPNLKRQLYLQIDEKITEAGKTPNMPSRSEILRQVQKYLEPL